MIIIFNYYLQQFDNQLVQFHHQPQFYRIDVPHYYILLLLLGGHHETMVQYKTPENVKKIIKIT